MDAIGPDVDIALRRQIALLPRGVFVKPTVLQPADGGCRQPGSILAEQRRQSFREVAGGDTFQVKDRQQCLDRFRAAHVGRQDRRREPDAVGVGGGRLAIAYTRLANGDRTDTGHHLAFRQVTVAHDALVAVRCLQIGMLAKKVRDLGLDRLGQQSTRPIAQNFGELIVDASWLNQLDDVIFGHGISLLRWRSGCVKHPHDMPPFRFPPSPTFSDSSNTPRKDIHNSDVPKLCQSCDVRHKGMCGALNANELVDFAKFTRVVKVSAGDVLLQEQGPIRSYANVMRGVLKLTKTMADGRQQIVGLQFAPDFVGRLHQDESPVRVEACSDVEVCSITTNALRKMLEENPTLEAKLLHQALREVDQAREWMLALGRKTAHEKVASFLMMMVRQIDPFAGGDGVTAFDL